MKKYNTAPLHGCILKLSHKYCIAIVKATYKIQSLFKTRKQQHGGWKKEVTVKFYGNWCLPVITWYKQQLWKQAWQITYTMEKKFLCSHCYFWRFANWSFSSRLKNIKYTLVCTSLSCISAEVKILQILFIKSKFSLYMKIFQLMCQLVNLFWKIAIYNAGCVFRLFLWRTEKSFLIKIL